MRLLHFYTSWSLLLYAIVQSFNLNHSLTFYNAVFVFVIGQLIALINYIQNKASVIMFIAVSLVHTFLLSNTYLPHSQKEKTDSLLVLFSSLLLYVSVLGYDRIFDIYIKQGAQKYLRSEWYMQ